MVLLRGRRRAGSIRPPDDDRHDQSLAIEQARQLFQRHRPGGGAEIPEALSIPLHYRRDGAFAVNLF